MEAYIAGDYRTGGLKLTDTIQFFKPALSDCKRVGDHMEKWNGWIEDMMYSNLDYEELSNQIYAASVSVNSKYISHESSRQWLAGDFYVSGIFYG